MVVLDALTDSTNAIELDQNNGKAYLRQGTALYNQNRKEDAWKTFVRGLEIDCKIIAQKLNYFFYLIVWLF